jgi:glycerol kinase
MSYGHPVKPYWNLSGIINTTGKAIQWCRDLLGFSDYEDFFSAAKKSAPGSGGMVFLPYLAGERSPVWDSKVRGLWRGISLNSSQSEAANSVLEGICFAIRDVLSVMEEKCEYVKH